MHQLQSQSLKRLAFCGLGSLFLLIGGSQITACSFDAQANKARETEAENYMGAILRSQQAHFLEADQFTDDLTSLGVNIPSETENYRYAIELSPQGQAALVTATAKIPELRSFTGVAYAIADAQGEFVGLDKALCISETPQQSPPAPPELVQAGAQVEVSCAAGSQVVE